MVSLHQVEEQLKQIGCNFRFWGRPEIRELQHILIEGETIAQAVNGRYEGGFALLCVTDHRLLLIDKKPMFLTLEDIRFDMISEIDYSSHLLEGTVTIMTPNRKMVFIGWNQARLRILLNYVQQRISDIRQHYMQRQFQPQFQQRDEQYTAPVVGSLIMQGSAQHTLPSHMYTKTSLTLRRHRIPKFY